MMRYRHKLMFVEAQQWFPDMEIPELENMPCRYQTGSSGYGAINSRLTLRPGYWVLHHQDGSFETMSDEQFQSKYEEVELHVAEC